MNSNEHVYERIDASGNLPVLPEVLLNLLTACEEEDSSLLDISDIISKDPALSLRVLQLVNSAYYGFRHDFSGIEQAVVYLGANTIKNLALTTSVHQVFEGKVATDSAGFDPGSFWYHSLMTATLAKRLAVETGKVDGEEAYLAGLLHDIGKLLLISAFPESYSISPAPDSTDNDICRLEVELVGVDHCQAGSWLVRQWKLSSLVADVLQYHHESEDNIREAFPLVRIVYVANAMTRLAEGELDHIRYPYNHILNLEDIDLKGFVNSAAEEVDQIATSMGIKVTRLQMSSSKETQNPDQILENGDQQQARDSRIISEEVILEEDTNTAIAARVRNVSLLSSVQEELMQAEEKDGIFRAFEKSMALLFDIGNVLFFFPDEKGELLLGQTSGRNHLSQASRSLTLPIHQSSSLIVKTLWKKSPAGYLVLDREGESIADQQVLSVFECDKAYPVPLLAEKSIVGVAVLGMPGSRLTLFQSDCQLLKVIAHQLALRIYLDEEKNRKAEALHRERLDAISMTARKFAHEINNPLGIIGNYLITLQRKISGEQDVKDDLSIISEELQRISSMVNQMEVFSQTPFSTTSQVNLNEVISDIVHLSRASLFSNTDTVVSFVPATELPRIVTSKDAIKQILLNLLKNAAEAMVQKGGRVVLRTRKYIQEGEIGQSGVEIIVSDSGPGLPDIVKENLYKPFVTTKQDGHSGLGLSIVHKAVNDIGGTLLCSSSQADGTTFTIRLPRI